MPPPKLEAPPSALLDFEEPPVAPSAALDFLAAGLIAAKEAEAEAASSRGGEPELDVFTAAGVQAHFATVPGSTAAGSTRQERRERRRRSPCRGPPLLHPQHHERGFSGEYVEHCEVAPDHNFVDADWDAD